ncbi:MAG: hypothetical protein NTZ12_11130 [Candidatus Aminicenantes bacterium]|nr:hypothetical protein [Candidatus Aminicenantes bacterium]
MGLKSIFQQGLKERERRKSLGKMSGELKDKEKDHAELLTALGQKAWESRVNITTFADICSALGETQGELDDLRARAEQLQKQRQDFAEKKKQEIGRLAAVLKEVEDKRRDADKRLDEQKNALQSGQKETQRAKSRLAAIADERIQLQNKSVITAETEKDEIANSLNLLAKEEEALQAGIGCHNEANKPLAELVAALQEESIQLQKRIDCLRQEQKQVTSDLDKKISALKNDLAKNGEKARETESRLNDNFRQLGGKLVAAECADPSLAKEMTAVLKARTKIDGVKALIGGLERQKDDEQVSAYKKMIAIIIGGIIVLAAIIAVLFLLLSPKKKEIPLAAVQNLGVQAQQPWNSHFNSLFKALPETGTHCYFRISDGKIKTGRKS